MRSLALFAAILLAAAPIIVAPSVAYADGIERPRQRVRPRPTPPPELEGAREVAPAPQVETNLVTLPQSFFAGSSGGVGADIGGGSYSSTTVIVRGGSVRASAFASARASAWAGGRSSGGHGCACR